MKFLFFTDSHFTAKNPMSRLDNIQDTIRSKLSDVKDIILSENVDVILHGGDLFHYPDVSNKFVGELAEIFKDFNIPIYVTGGNHDVFGYNIDTLDNTKLGLLAKTGVINLLNRENPRVFDYNGVKIGVEGQEYHSNIDTNIEEDYKIQNEDVDYSILVIHSMLLDHEFFNDIKHTQIKDVYTKADFVLSGHYHPGYKTVEKDGTTFINPGSFLRVDCSNGSYKYTPSVIILDINEDGATYKAIPLKSAKPANEIFKEKGNSNKSEYQNALDSLNEKIKSTKLSGISVTDLIKQYGEAHLDDMECINLINDRLNLIEAEISVDNGYVDEAENVFIKSVHIKNFQAHEDTKIDFINGFNVIKGESQVGKSSILRAIQWVFYDKPTGNGFIRTGSKRTTVKVELSNGMILVRTRTKSNAGEYKIYTPDGEIKEYKGFSNNIPIEITNAHQTPELVINNVKYRINISNQHDPAFLAAFSPTEKVSLIGALVGTEKVDIARKQILADKRKKGMALKTIQDFKEKEVEKLKGYKNLDKVEQIVSVLEKGINKYDTDMEKLENLSNLRDDYYKFKATYIDLEKEEESIVIPDKDTYKLLVDKFSLLEKLLSAKEKYTTLTSSLSKLNEELKTVENIDKITDSYNLLLNLTNKLDKITSFKEELEYLKGLTFEFNVNLDEILESFNLLKSKLNIVYKLESCRETLKEGSKDILALGKNVDLINIEIVNIKNEVSNRLNSIKGSRCETCGQIIEDISHIL